MESIRIVDDEQGPARHTVDDRRAQAHRARVGFPDPERRVSDRQLHDELGAFAGAVKHSRPERGLVEGDGRISSIDAEFRLEGRRHGPSMSVDHRRRGQPERAGQGRRGRGGPRRSPPRRAAPARGSRPRSVQPCAQLLQRRRAQVVVGPEAAALGPSTPAATSTRRCLASACWLMSNSGTSSHWQSASGALVRSASTIRTRVGSARALRMTARRPPRPRRGMAGRPACSTRRRPAREG